MRALVRRSNQAQPESEEVEATPETDSAVVVGDVSIDSVRHEVVVRGQSVDLPLKEFTLLSYLMSNAGRVVTRGTLIDRVWGEDYVGDTKTLDVHIKRLRSKIELDPSNPDIIVTIRGLGYKYQRPEG